MNDIPKRVARRGLEIGTYHMGYGNQGGLHNLIVGDAEYLRRVFLEEEMQAGETGAKTARASMKLQAAGAIVPHWALWMTVGWSLVRPAMQGMT